MGKKRRAAPPKTQPRSPVLPLLVILLVTFVAFSPSLTNGFTDWDDNIYVSQNPLVERLSWENLKTIFTTSHNGIYVPLSMVSYSIEFALFGKNPAANHATNLILHLLNCLLVFWFFCQISQKKVALAFIVGILFGIHPLHVESVAWISERKDVLYTFFFFLALGSYLRYGRDGNKRAYGLTLVFFLLSLLSKPMGITFPLILVLIDYFKTGGIQKKRLVEKAPFFLLSLVFAIGAIFASRPQAASLAVGTAAASVPPVHKMILAAYAVGFYVIKIFFPVKLAALYPYRETLGSLNPLLLALSPVILAALAAAVGFSLRSTKKILFGIFFFLATLSPILQLISVPGNSIVADRYTYVAGLGIFYLAGVFLTWNLWDRVKPAKLIGAVAFVCLVVILSLATCRRCHVWKDDMALWKDVLQKYPNVPVAHNKIGLAYAGHGDFETAVTEYNEALALDSSYAGAYNNRAVAYRRLKKYDKALADYTKAIELNPRSADLYYNFGNLYHELGMYDRAIEQYTEALRVAPRSARIYNNRGLSFTAKGEIEGAIADYSKAIEILPTFDLAFMNRGIALSYLGQYGKALADLDKAIEWNPENAAAYFGRGLTYAKTKEYEKALADFDRAIAIKPDYEDALNKRIYVYLVRKDFEKAWREIERLQSLGVTIEPALRELYQKAKAGNN